MDHSATREPASARICRRELLRWGGGGCLGLNLSRLFEARAVQAAKARSAAPEGRIKACIVLFYYGGPSHLDMFDLKPDAPAEVRGEFLPISTTVSGLQICEHLPRIAQIMHKVSLIRSMHHGMRLHDAACVQTLTGRPPFRGDGEFFAAPGEATLFPSMGAAYSYLRRDRPLPVANAALPFVIKNVVPVPCQTGGFLGAAWNPFQVQGDPATMSYRAESLRLAEGLTLDRLSNRFELLRSVGEGHGHAQTGVAEQLRAHYRKALELIKSDEIRHALEIERESPATRERYGLGSGAEPGRALRGQSLLLARRLVEAGTPFVNVFDFRQQGQNWDAHAQNFKQHKDVLLPAFDQAYSALIEDLDQRGLLDSTLVLALGEFGRTPKINAGAGRDHWPDCYSALVAGGGVKGGYVHGASDKLGAYPDRDPVSPGDLAATIFDAFGIDPATEIHDATNRPFKLAEGRPMQDLFA